MSSLPPLLMRPAYVEKLWGGSRIGRLPAKAHCPPPAHKAIGESWEVADLPEGQSHVDDVAICASFSGQPLSALVAQHGPALIGTAAPEGRFPILVKLIDAAEPLSVQVHPGQDYADLHPGTFSKDEAWLVVDVDDGGTVLHGFVDGVDRALFVDAVKKGLPHELMRHVPVRPGDVLHVRPGVVHAIGAGVMILEVQEPSDTTFRVWDFSRRDHQGNLRPLHLNQALEVAAFGPQPPALNGPRHHDDGSRVLCQTRSFAMGDRLVGGDVDVLLPVSAERALVLHALESSIDVEYDGRPFQIALGGSCILPASCGGVRFPARGRSSRLIIMQ